MVAGIVILYPKFNFEPDRKSNLGDISNFVYCSVIGGLCLALPPNRLRQLTGPIAKRRSHGKMLQLGSYRRRSLGRQAGYREAAATIPGPMSEPVFPLPAEIDELLKSLSGSTALSQSQPAPANDRP